MRTFKLLILPAFMRRVLCGFCLAMTTSCQQSKSCVGDRYIAPYANMDGLCFYNSSAGDKLFFTFFDANSFVTYADVITNVHKTGSVQTLEVSFVQSASNPHSLRFAMIEGEKTLVVVPFDKFNPRTCKVVYKDIEAIHEVKYVGVRTGEFKPYRLPKTPNVIGDPFGKQDQ